MVEEREMKDGTEQLLSPDWYREVRVEGVGATSAPALAENPS